MVDPEEFSVKSCTTTQHFGITGITSEELDVNVPAASSVPTADPGTREQSSLFYWRVTAKHLNHISKPLAKREIL